MLVNWDGNYQFFKNNRFKMLGNSVQEHNLQIWTDQSDLFYALMKRFSNLGNKYNFSPKFILLADKGVAKKRINGQTLQYQNVIENFQKNLSLPQLCDIIHLSYLSDKRKQALIALIDKRSSEICIT